MNGLYLRHKESGDSVIIYPFDEDRNFWYVNETRDDEIIETLRYSKSSWDEII